MREFGPQCVRNDAALVDVVLASKHQDNAPKLLPRAADGRLGHQEPDARAAEEGKVSL